MKVQDYFDQLTHEKENGIKLSDNDIRNRIDDIIACAKSEIANNLRAVNAIMPIFNQAIISVQNTKTFCNKCADLMNEMRSMDVVKE